MGGTGYTLEQFTRRIQRFTEKLKIRSLLTFVSQGPGGATGRSGPTKNRVMQRFCGPRLTASGPSQPISASQFESLTSGCQRTSLIEFVTTKIELKAIAAAAMTGLNRPTAATGMATTL